MRKRRSFIFIIVGIFLILALIFGAYIFRQNQKKDFDELFNSKTILKIEYGIIEKEEALKEKNALFKRIYQDNYHYLYITENNTLFVYYLDWYYSFDPMKGYNIMYNEKIDADKVNKILEDIKTKEIDSLYNKNKDDYITLHHDDKTTYINKKEMQKIFQDQEIILDLYE